jgi:hypothetical protein
VRQRFDKRCIYLRAEQQRDTLLSLVRNLPLDADKPLQVTIEEYRPVRKKSQNDLMWSGPLADIAEQAYLEGKRYSAKVWHEYFKANLLPNEFDPVLCRDGYVKHEYGPDGEPVLIGSTTLLTVKGMALYLTEMEAFGASLGVTFSANPNER